jgi:hypothetical protein
MIFIESLMAITRRFMKIINALMIAIRRYTAIIKPLTKIPQACTAAVHISSRANSSLALIGLAM